MTKSIADLDKAIAQLNQQKLQLLAQEQKRKRAVETRQKAILGGWLLVNDPCLVKEIVGRLRRPQDRKAFGIISQHEEQDSANKKVNPTSCIDARAL